MHDQVPSCTTAAAHCRAGDGNSSRRSVNRTTAHPRKLCTVRSGQASSASSNIGPRYCRIGALAFHEDGVLSGCSRVVCTTRAGSWPLTSSSWPGQENSTSSHHQGETVRHAWSEWLSGTHLAANGRTMIADACLYGRRCCLHLQRLDWRCHHAPAGNRVVCTRARV